MGQTVNYVSDAEGFKVAATNLPKAPLPEAAASAPAPAPYVAQAPTSEVPTPVKVAPAPVPAPYVAPAPVPYVASIPTLAPYVAPAPSEAEEHDDMEVISGEQESVANSVPYVAAPVHYYAPQQGYYQPPVTPAVVQAPVHAPAYYAPYHGYVQPAPASVPMGYQTAPAAVVPAPVAAPVPGGATQFHAQSELGEYNYGYANENSAKQEFKTADGIVQGTYSYVDANGIVETVNYVSDAEGFRVAATNLPKAPAPYVAPIATIVEPEIDLRNENIFDIRK